MTTAASAKATEIKRAADADAYRFNADRSAYATSGNAFVIEHFYNNLYEGAVEDYGDDSGSPNQIQIRGGAHSRSASEFARLPR